jgi:hypothetical protein
VSEQYAEGIPFGGIPKMYKYEDPHVKAFFLLSAFLTRIKSFPVTDYAIDTNTVLDQAVRILQAMIDISSHQGYMKTTLGIIKLMQCIKQGIWPHESSLWTIPAFRAASVAKIGKNITSLGALCRLKDAVVGSILEEAGFSDPRILKIILSLPSVRVFWDIEGVGKSKEIVLSKGQNYKMKVDISRNRPLGRKDTHAHCPEFPKPQYEGWFVMLTNKEKDELVVLKRIGQQDTRITSSLEFTAPTEEGDYDYTLMCQSDVYVGLDEEVHIRFKVA